jgi:FkbM family methyltransferase
MKKLIYNILGRFFGKKKYARFFLILKNIGLEGLNYRNTDIASNGEFFLISEISRYYYSKENLVLFDVGANVGNYSKKLADTFKERSIIYAFEPFSTPYKQLEELSKIHCSIKPQNLGLSDKNEELSVFSSDDFSEVGGIYNRNITLKNVSLNKTELSQFETIASFSSKTKLTHIHFIKIDVEGHELAVLKGGLDFLKTGKIDFIQFEFGSGNYYSKTYFLDFFEILNPHFNLYRLLKDGLAEIKEYDSDLEIHVLSNFVAIHKTIAPDFLAKKHVK